MKKCIAILLCLCLCFACVACSNNTKPNETKPPVSTDTPTETPEFKYLTKEYTDSALSLGLFMAMQNVTWEGNTFTANGEKYFVPYESANNFPSLIKISQYSDYQTLYGNWIYHKTEKSWTIRSNYWTCTTFPIEDEILYIQNEWFDDFVYVSRNTNGFAVKKLDKTGAVVETIDLNQIQNKPVIQIATSCGRVYAYTKDAVYEARNAGWTWPSLTKIPTNSILLPTLNHSIGGENVEAIWYLPSDNTTLYYLYNAHTGAGVGEYCVFLPETYTTEDVLWVSWSNGSFDIIFKDKTWWHTDAQTASVVGLELQKDNVACDWLQNHCVDWRCVNGRLFLTADDGYTYFHDTMYPGHLIGTTQDTIQAWP